MVDSGWAAQLGQALATVHAVPSDRLAALPSVFDRSGGSQEALAGPLASRIRSGWRRLAASERCFDLGWCRLDLVLLLDERVVDVFLAAYEDGIGRMIDDIARAYDPPVDVRNMHTQELPLALSVWRQANIARGAPHGGQRTERIRAKLSAPDALPFVALRPGIVGMALAEPGRFDEGAGALDPSLLHISMVFVRPVVQRTGVGLLLMLHVLEAARSLGYRRVDVWTARDNDPARKLYERAGMTHTGKTAPLRKSEQLQYESLLASTR